MPLKDKNLLLISANFPPVSTSGVHRMIRIVRYLTEMGVRVSVLTVDETSIAKGFEYDEALLEKVPSEVEILRVPAFQGYKKFLDLKQKINPSGQRKKAMPNPMLSEPTRLKRQGKQKSFGQWVRDAITLNLNTPDNYAMWIRSAVQVGVKYVREHGIENILSSSPPGSAHVVAMRLKQRTRVHWIADFRDPWSKKQWFNPEMTAFKKRRIEICEQKTLRHADKIIMNTQEMLEIYRQVYNGIMDQKGVVIPNGFDPADYVNLPPMANRNSKIVILHTGTFYRSRSPVPFLEGFGLATASGEIKPEHFRIKFIGSIGDFGADIENVAKHYHFEDSLVLVPSIPHKECLAEMTRADILLLLQPGTQIQVPAKLYEYIAIGRPIFAISAPGAIQRLIQDHQLGWWADADDVVQIQKVFGEISSRVSDGHGQWEIPPSALETFNGQKLVERISALLQ